MRPAPFRPVHRNRTESHHRLKRVRGHEKVPTGGQVEVSTGGQIKVSTPCSSCRSGTAGPDGDGEGANQSPPPPGSSIEVCEGPHGHHFCLSTARVLPRRRRSSAAPPTGPSSVMWTSSKPTRRVCRRSRGPSGPTITTWWPSWSPNASRSQRVGSRPSGCCRSLARPDTRVRAATSGAWSPTRNRCGAVIITRVAVRRCGHRVSIW